MVVCAFIALGPGSTDLAEAVVWLRKTLLTAARYQRRPEPA